jgi:hypothetical protein
MKDEEIKLKKIEVSHTLGGYRRCRSYSVVRFRYTIVNRSRRICYHQGPTGPDRVKVWLGKKPMDMCVCESEEHEHGVGAGANTTLLVVYYES